MGIIVQKFGGTSVSTPERREKVLEKIIGARPESNSVIAVVSAIGRKGEPYATDSLIELASTINDGIAERELDLLLSCGEVISGVLLTGMLQLRGFKAICLTGAQAGIITDNSYGAARIKKVKPETLIQYLEQGYIVVVAGYQGITEKGEVTTLGRGGSDTTAAALGVALEAERIEIYTDVNGLKTADPRIVDEARTLDRITYSEISQLAYEGAGVIHPRAVEIAMQGNIPIEIKCTFTNEPGTLVTNRAPPNIETQIENDRLITGITQMTNMSQLQINLSGKRDHKFERELFQKVADELISIDFINIMPDRIVFSVQDKVAQNAVKIITEMGVKVKVRNGCAKVAAVGAGMTGVPGVMARIVKALTLNNIEILQSADSYTTIWCLVESRNLERAVKALHSEFDLAKSF